MKAIAPESSATLHSPRELDALPSPTGREGGVTLRVVLLCLTLAVVFGYALPVIDYKLFNTFLGGSHLPAGAIGVLLILVLVVNPLLRLLRKKWALSRNEALTVYISCLFSSLVPGHGSENFIIPNLISPFYYATRENKWLEFLTPYVKPWMMPAVTDAGTVNQSVVDGWYQGLPADAAVPWGAWLVPLIFWIGFVLTSYIMFGCLSVILRAQWAEREALAFPLLKLPLQMTEDMDDTNKKGVVGEFFRNPMMWGGFAIAVFIQAMKGLHLYFPDFPDFPTSLPTGPLLSEAPWNQIGGMPDISVFPMVVGITYLLTSEISFSLWFFYLFIKFENIAAYTIGYPRGTLPGADGFPDKLFTGNQVGGCYIAYVALILWTGREHFKHVARRAIGRAPATADEATEMMSYPLAFWGFVLSIAIMIGATVASGVRVDIAIALWVSYLVLALGLARVAVEGGMLALQHHTSPLGAIARLINSGPSNWMTVENGVSSAAFFSAGHGQPYARLHHAVVHSWFQAGPRSQNFQATVGRTYRGDRRYRGHRQLDYDGKYGLSRRRRAEFRPQMVVAAGTAKRGQLHHVDDRHQQRFGAAGVVLACFRRRPDLGHDADALAIRLVSTSSHRLHHVALLSVGGLLVLDISGLDVQEPYHAFRRRRRLS